MTTTSINEIGAEISSSLQMPVGASFNFNSELLAAKGLKDILAKIEKVSRVAENFKYTVQFIGLTEADRKKIRLCCRELWTAEENAG